MLNSIKGQSPILFCIWSCVLMVLLCIHKNIMIWLSWDLNFSSMKDSIFIKTRTDKIVVCLGQLKKLTNKILKNHLHFMKFIFRRWSLRKNSLMKLDIIVNLEKIKNHIVQWTNISKVKKRTKKSIPKVLTLEMNNQDLKKEVKQNKMLMIIIKS